MRFLSQLCPRIPLQEAGGRPHAVRQQIKRAISYWEGGGGGEGEAGSGSRGLMKVFVGHVVFVFPRVGSFI